MQCPRCQGLMLTDHFFDLLYDGGHGSFVGWRCLCCGNILDPVILRNRQAEMMRTSENPFLVKEDNRDTLVQEPIGIVTSAA